MKPARIATTRPAGSNISRRRGASATAKADGVIISRGKGRQAAVKLVGHPRLPHSPGAASSLRSAERRKGDKKKAEMAARLRKETTMSWPWIARRLAMGHWRTAANAVRARTVK